MKCDIVKLHFKSPVHLGEKEGMLEDTSIILHSDMLFSAICHGYRMLYGEKLLNDLLERFVNSDPPFLISSAFPFYKKHFFLPVAYSSFPDDPSFKHLELIPKTLWENSVVNGTIVTSGHCLVQDGCVLLPHEGTCGKSVKDECPVWKETEVQRVSLDRITSASNIFNFRQVNFNESSGLYFFLKWNDASFIDRIKGAFRLLGDEGIGGDKGSGKGAFKPEFDEDEIELKSFVGNKNMLLSLVFPSENETSEFNGIYDFKMRGGFVYSPENTTRRKKYVRMLTEGSVLYGKKPVGSFVDITPDGFTKHKVYRYGYAFSVSF
ncbi:MAG: type III-A CRISPR-associated RAMP protein Csm4 [Desulfobacteraceae bacterium]|jgi:CRISPR-associated protein Csm4